MLRSGDKEGATDMFCKQLFDSNGQFLSINAAQEALKLGVAKTQGIALRAW